MSSKYTLPTTKLFVDRLEPDYRANCREEKMTVTSATRPIVLQPSNAHLLSVHPTGMAVDLRVPPSRCSKWFDGTLWQLMSIGVINVIREHLPPHYHVAVFPPKYLEYAAREKGTK